MRTYTKLRGNCRLRINANSDWSGQAYVRVEHRSNGELVSAKEFEVPGEDLIRGDDRHLAELNDITTAEWGQAVSLAVESYVVEQIEIALDNVRLPMLEE